ncbi:MAG: glycoside hydrolase family 2 protein [Candidatus Aminicenantales bacterium]
MIKTSFSRTFLALVVAGLVCSGSLFPQGLPRGFGMGAPGEGDFSLNLRNWFIQSSARVRTGGEQISLPDLGLERWYPAVVPSTILGTLVQNNAYQDILSGENLKTVPAADFEVPWWYRTEFPVTADPAKTAFRLEFDGINYRADIWLNGKKIAEASRTFGPFRRISIDVTEAVLRGAKNVLAVEVFPPRPGEPSIGFADWNPAPPDRSLGLWREVRLRSSGDVSIEAPFVQTKLNLETLLEARLTVSAELRNNSRNKATGTFEGRLESLTFSREVSLEPGETKKIVFTPETDPKLILKNPRVWWTHDLGKPDLYFLLLSFQQKGVPPPAKPPEAADKEKGKEEDKGEKKKRESDGPWGRGKGGPRVLFSDMKIVRFGIREVADYTTGQGARGFKLNGKKLLIRGAGWTDDILLENRPRRNAAEIAYARHMNLNALRLEGFWGSNEDIYNLCDESGILILAGWSCQWEWEDLLGRPVDKRYGGITGPEDIKLVAESWRDQVRWLRHHPSILAWLEASDLLPAPDLEKEYRKILAEEDPTRPSLASAKGWTSEISGKSGVKMLGPYDWVPPVYWYIDRTNGGAYGFNTESGPGPQIPPIESLRKMLPEKDLWPIGEAWLFHAPRGRFNNLDRYNEAMTRRLGAPKDLADYERKAQFLNYEGSRAMFEAFAAGRPEATGVIFWMLNSAWPKLWWQLYDYYLMPNGAFFGARKACAPLHVLYDYGTRRILAANGTLKPEPGLKVSIRAFDIGLKEIYTKMVPLDLAAEELKTIDSVPEIPGVESAWFLDLRILGKKNVLVDANFYCLAPKQDVLDEAGTTWAVTPVKEFADLTALERLAPVRIKEKHSFKKDGAGQVVTVKLENPTENLAFQVELNVYKGKTEEVVTPIFWDDNYLTLLPGESRTIQGFFALDDLTGADPELRIRGWNLE